MKINFTGHNIEVTDSLRNLVEKKFERFENHYNQTIIKANVILSVEKLVNRAEINLHIAGAEINAHAESEDMYKSVDQMLDKLERQVLKIKERRDNHRG